MSTIGTTAIKAVNGTKRGVVKTRTRQWREARRAYLVWGPLILYTSLWSVIPLLFGLYLGFTDYNAINGKPVWVGFKNFETFFMISEFPILLLRQVALGAVCLAVNTVLSFGMALLLNVKSRLKGIYRTAVYVPSVAASTTTTGVWIALLNPAANQGINKIITALGGTAIPWNYSALWMFFWIVIYNSWKSMGPAVILWLGGLQGIDPSLYEAAKVDGATFGQQVRYITLPGLKYITMFILLTGIIAAMQMFDQVMLISAGNPYGQTDVLMYRIYRDGFRNFNLGMAGAESLILGLATIVFAVGYFKLQQRRDDK
jgi:ABC-type sugar transport system permease subunit